MADMIATTKLQRRVAPWAMAALIVLAGVLMAGGGHCRQPLLEVTGFHVQASPKPKPGERVQVEFTLRNISGKPLKLGSRLGVFLAAKIEIPGSSHPMRRNFGKQLAGDELSPGQALKFTDSLVWDLDGVWTLIPGCQLEDDIVYFEQQGGKFLVGEAGAANPGPAQPSTQAAAPRVQPSPVPAKPAPEKPVAAPPPPAPAPVPPAASARPPSMADCRGDGLCIKILSYNIDSLTADRNKAGWDEFMGILAREKPDLLVTPETLATDVPKIARAAGLPHFEGVKAYGAEDWRPRVGVYSRWPMRIKAVALPVSGGQKERHFGLAEVDVAGVPVAFYGLHLSREGLVDSHMKGMVKEFLGMGRRQEEMETVVKELARDKHHFKILAGDLNTYPMSGPYRLLEKSLADAFPGSAEGTYRLDKMRSGDSAKVERSALEALPNPKIDHIFHSQGLSPLEARVITQGPSDHFPITATLRLNLEDGSVSPARVKAVQELLAKSGLLTGPAGGRIDAATRRAVAKVQAKKGAPVDGMLNDQTLKLFGF